MENFIAKTIYVNLRYLRSKLLKYEENHENSKEMCDTFDHELKNILYYIMS